MQRTLTILAVAVAAATALAPPVLAEPAPAEADLPWGDCEGLDVPGLKCTTVNVPLDHRNPDGPQIELALSKLASKNPEKRRGVLLTNPGGPGGSGLSLPGDLADRGMPQSVLDTYDIIGLDPRGVGKSTPVTCDLTPEQQGRGNIPPYAHNAADVVEQAKNAKAIAEQCAKSETAHMLPFASTAATARDMDLIREKLGEDKLSFLGYSYGTHLGAVYTTLFPDRSDRVVLDSNLVPAGLDREASRMFGPGMEARFPDFAEFAAERPEYGLGTTPEAVTAKFYELSDRLDENPSQGIDGSTFRLLTFAALYRDSKLPGLAETWQALDRNQPLPTPATGAAELDLDNAVSSHLYVLCNDNRWPRSIGTYVRDTAVDRERYPMFGGAGANIRPCAFWSREPAEPPVRVNDRGPSNVLLTQNTNDPATPLAGAEKMHRALGDRSRLVTAEQDGHGAYLFGENQCLNDAVTDYLATGKRPADDLACS